MIAAFLAVASAATLAVASAAAVEIAAVTADVRFVISAARFVVRVDSAARAVVASAAKSAAVEMLLNVTPSLVTSHLSFASFQRS